MATKTDLWGEIVPQQERTPLSILREQAALLGTKTANLVEATVETNASNGTFYHTFSLVVPSMDYTYSLFSVRHGADLYPVVPGGEPLELGSEHEFVAWLAEKLSSARTKKIISNLLAQAKS